MKNFYIVYNPDKDEDNRITSELTAYIESQNGACKAMDCYSFSACDKQHVTDELESFDCILVLGGDGTLLNVASSASHVEIPLFGINLGTVGFLTEGEITNWQTIIDRLLADDYSMQDRMMIRGTVRTGDGKECRKRALNDIVISRAGFSRLIGLDVYVNVQN